MFSQLAILMVLLIFFYYTTDHSIHNTFFRNAPYNFRIDPTQPPVTPIKTRPTIGSTNNELDCTDIVQNNMMDIPNDHTMLLTSYTTPSPKNPSQSLNVLVGLCDNVNPMASTNGIQHLSDLATPTTARSDPRCPKID